MCIPKMRKKNKKKKHFFQKKIIQTTRKRHNFALTVTFFPETRANKENSGPITVPLRPDKWVTT